MEDVHSIDRPVDWRAISPEGPSVDDDRGGSAASPKDIAVGGWKGILPRVYRGISDDRILANAAAVTFYSLLALFPAIAALVSIYGLFADPNSITNQFDALSGILPGGGMIVIRDQLTRLASKGSGSLTVGFVIGLVVSLWSANGGMKAMFDALNAVYEEKERRSFLQLDGPRVDRGPVLNREGAVLNETVNSVFQKFPGAGKHRAPPKICRFLIRYHLYYINQFNP
jgi:membrane protein